MCNGVSPIPELGKVFLTLERGMRMARISTMIILPLCALLALSWTANAQTTNATIVGDVSDQEGGRIAGANVTVRNIATGVARELKTNDGDTVSQHHVVPHAG